MIIGQISLPVLDTGIVIAYILGILALGIWSGYRRKTSSTQLFLAGRSLPWTIIGPGLFCANISTIHLVGLAADGHRTGLGVGNFISGTNSVHCRNMSRKDTVPLLVQYSLLSL